MYANKLIHSFEKYFGDILCISKLKKFMGMLNSSGKLISLPNRCITEKINSKLVMKKTLSEEITLSIGRELMTSVVAIKVHTYMLLDGKFGVLSEEQKESLNQVKTNTELLIDGIFKISDRKAELVKKN